MVLLNFGVDDIMQTAAAVLLVTRIAYFTMGLPIMLRFVLLGRAACQLVGHQNAYIGVWDMSVLVTQSECWSPAVSEIYLLFGWGRIWSLDGIWVIY